MLAKSVWNIYCFKLWDKVYSRDGLIFIALPECARCCSDDTHGRACPVRPHSKLHLPSYHMLGTCTFLRRPPSFLLALSLFVCRHVNISLYSHAISVEKVVLYQVENILQ